MQDADANRALCEERFEIIERYPGLEHLLIGFPMSATLQQFKDQLTCFAQEVMLAFKRATVSV